MIVILFLFSVFCVIINPQNRIVYVQCEAEAAAVDLEEEYLCPVEYIFSVSIS